ncbi:1-acyl-sn-glycerol-3-phosphate acyltransferase [Altererythrobacter xiamenensis]|uniref:1-acyl-sn-glycerol-3-phosphate acyltransferase n=1 Tax=Altererythrobacter xiamenensis TaxID=1316679 RepID=A0A1Y6ENN4_9SPHN|nr:lysophospholipid acyltransferase family protein [Altererythrobacter xiamenensis]SMQ64285.1 1-acyl-sn-glycerol-3-phosphate acyltransferase [Altererythrobacter xiamenensis]
MSVLRSLLYYPLFYGVSFFLVAGAAIASLIGQGALRRLVRMWTDWHRWCVNHILGIEVRIEGEVPEGAVLLAIKHESFFEAIDMPTLFEFPSVFAKRELFNIPLWGHSAVVYGLIPVSRDGGAKALRQMIGTARTMVEANRPLVIFPEGTRVPHGERRPLQSGFAGLYKLLGMSVVPVAVNSGPLYHRTWKRSGTVTYRFGEPIPAGLPRDEVEARVLDAMNALND